jgi:class 3 adenylate cyclase
VESGSPLSRLPRFAADFGGAGGIGEGIRAAQGLVGTVVSAPHPPTHYATVGDADVAYQIVGEGPFDLLYHYGVGSHLEWLWEDRLTADLLLGMASFSRLILFDRRGTGASDAVPSNAIPTWEDWTEDIGAVLDAAGSKQAAILGSLDGGPISILYTVAHPERVNALILYNTAAKYMAAEDYSIGAAPEEVDALLDWMRTGWGTSEWTSFFLTGEDPARTDLLARGLRSAATPRNATAQFDYVLRSLDVRQALSLIRVPTLVLHSRDLPTLPIEHGRYLADHIAGARLVEISGREIAPLGDPSHRVLPEIAEFLTGERPTVEAERLLATIVFTDIVGSTHQAAALGDKRWRSLLDAHDGVVRDELRRFRGREINTTGDGFIASFDGPARAIRCAQSIIAANRAQGIDLRVGLHSGECEVRGDDLGGLAVHIAARVGAEACSGEVLVSGTVKDLVAGSGIEFEARGEHELKGVPGSWRLYGVVS